MYRIVNVVTCCTCKPRLIIPSCPLTHLQALVINPPACVTRLIVSIQNSKCDRLDIWGVAIICVTRLHLKIQCPFTFYQCAGMIVCVAFLNSIHHIIVVLTPFHCIQLPAADQWTLSSGTIESASKVLQWPTHVTATLHFH